MVQASGEERAAHLAREAVELVDAGHREVRTMIYRECESTLYAHPCIILMQSG